MNGIAYGNGTFVAVGNAGTVLVSADTVTWTQVSCGTTQRLNTIIFGGNRFVAGGDSGTFLWSEEGTHWSNAGIALRQDITAIGFGQGSNFVNGLFVAFGSLPPYIYPYPATVLLSSADGALWETNSVSSWTFEGERFAAIVFGKERFVASVPPSPLFGGLSQAFFSSRPTYWSPVQGTPRGPIAFGNGIFVNTFFFDASRSGIPLSHTSLGGFSWPFDGYSASPYHALGLCFGGGRFVAVGEAGYTGSSTDGTNWTVQVTNPDSILKAVAYGDGSYVAVGDGGAILASSDGISWTKRHRGPDRNFYAVASAGDGFIVTGEGGTIAASSDGVAWEDVDRATSNSLYAAFDNTNHCVLAGLNGTILSGDSITNLEIRDSGTTQSLIGMTFGSGTFVAVGNSGTVTISTNTIDWEPQPSGTSNYLNEVAFGNGTFVAVGAGGTVITSPNGKSWSQQPSGTPQRLSDITFGNGRFVAVGYADWYPSFATNVIVSTDGTNWTPVLGVYPNWSGVVFGGGFFLIPDRSGPLLISRDGYTWIACPVTTNNPGLFDMAFNNGTFVSVGRFGRIVQSDPIVTLDSLFDGSTHLSIQGPRNRTYRIEANDSVTSDDWNEGVTLSNPPYSWTDLQSTGKSNRFYRAVLLP